MIRPIASVVVLSGVTLLAACSKDPKKQLEGRWVGEGVEHFSPAQKSHAEGWASGASFEFKGSNVKVSVPAESPREGTYQVTRAEGGALEIAFLRPSGERDTAEFHLEGTDHLRWQLGDGRSILFRKATD